MAANLSIEIGLSGNAAQGAKQITDAFKQIGQAGDTAVKSVQQKYQERKSICRIDRLHWRFLKRDLDAYIARNAFRAETVFGKEKIAK